MKTSPLLTTAALAASVAAAGVIPATAPLAAQTHEVVVGPNLRVGAGQYNEPWMAASPENPDFLIAVTQTGGMSFPDPTAAAGLSTRSNAAFLSRNGGVNWEPVTLPGDETGAFDPMVVPGPDGRMWILYCYVGANTMGGMLPDQPVRSDGTIMVWSTDDEGATWVGPARLRSPVPPDHARIAADWSEGPHRGRLYVVWNDVRDSFIRDDFQLFLHTLDDGGKTVSEPKLLATIPGGKLVATEPVVLSDGALLVTFYQYFFPLSDEKNSQMPFFTMRSEDGGETFSDVEVAFQVGTHSWPYAQTEMTSAFTLPIVAWDRTGGPHGDNIYIVWDQVSGGTSNIWFRRSTDGGRSWSDTMRLNDNDPPGPGAPLDDRMIPVVEVNRDGVVGVAWYDRRRDATRRCWELFFTSSSDGGETFGANVPVASAPSCPPPSHAPVARVHNLATDPDVKELSDEEIAKMDLIQRMTVVMAQQSRAGPGAILRRSGPRPLGGLLRQRAGQPARPLPGTRRRRQRRLSPPLDQPQERDGRTLHDHGGGCGRCPRGSHGRGVGYHGSPARGDGRCRLRSRRWHGHRRGADEERLGWCRARAGAAADRGRRGPGVVVRGEDGIARHASAGRVERTGEGGADGWGWNGRAAGLPGVRAG